MAPVAVLTGGGPPPEAWLTCTIIAATPGRRCREIGCCRVEKWRVLRRRKPNAAWGSTPRENPAFSDGHCIGSGGDWVRRSEPTTPDFWRHRSRCESIRKQRSTASPTGIRTPLRFSPSTTSTVDVVAQRRWRKSRRGTGCRWRRSFGSSSRSRGAAAAPRSRSEGSPHRRRGARDGRVASLGACAALGQRECQTHHRRRHGAAFRPSPNRRYAESIAGGARRAHAYGAKLRVRGGEPPGRGWIRAEGGGSARSTPADAGADRAWRRCNSRRGPDGSGTAHRRPAQALERGAARPR